MPALAVLNPEGNDPFLDYRDGPGECVPGVHPPVNFHAYAAATRGAFCDSTSQVLREPERFQVCLVLLRRKIAPCLDAVTKLKAAGLTVIVSWKECGPFQIADQLLDGKVWNTYAEILRRCDGVLSPTFSPPPIPPGVNVPVKMIPTPYPVEFEAWNYSRPIPQRKGIFLGTRELFVFARRQVAGLSLALRAARAENIHVTVINTDKGKGRKLLEALAGPAMENLRIHEGRLGYGEYLKLISAHRLVLQLDRGEVPGQVAGDCLLCRTVCLGGNSTVEEIAFQGQAMPEATLPMRLHDLLTDDEAMEKAVTHSQTIAAKALSYGAVARQLSDWVRELS